MVNTTMRSIIESLSLLIVTVRRNLFASVITTLLLIALIMMWSVKGHVSTWLDAHPTAEEKAERISKSSEVSNMIHSMLQDDLESLDADRVFIRRFGIVDKTISTATITHMVVSRGTSGDYNLQEIPISRIPTTMDAVFGGDGPPRCAALTSDQVTNVDYKELLYKAGVDSFYVCPILDLEDNPIGLIYASYTSSEPRPSLEEITDCLQETALRISGYLRDVEEKPWWRLFLDI